MIARILSFGAAAVIALAGMSCSKSSLPATEIKRYPIDGLEGVITTSNVTFDAEASSDGKGSIRVDAAEPTTVRLFEAGDVEVENARLTYAAKVRTENVEGRAYLEMWCHFPGKGEFFARGLQSPVTGTSEWTSQEAIFFLRKDEKPDHIKLNLVIEGKGTVWIDDVRLMKGPLD